MDWLAETLIDDERKITYKFNAGFEYARKYTDLKRDYQSDYDVICSDVPDTDIYRAVFKCALVSVNDKPINEHEIDALIMHIIGRFGCSACSFLCHKIMFSTYIGEIESKKCFTAQKWAEIMSIATLSRSGIFSKAGFLWVTVSATFGAVGCLIISGLQRLG